VLPRLRVGFRRSFAILYQLQSLALARGGAPPGAKPAVDKQQ